jgi:hypothetical protein
MALPEPTCGAIRQAQANEIGGGDVTLNWTAAVGGRVQNVLERQRSEIDQERQVLGVEGWPPWRAVDSRGADQLRAREVSSVAGGFGFGLSITGRGAHLSGALY